MSDQASPLSPPHDFVWKWVRICCYGLILALLIWFSPKLLTREGKGAKAGENHGDSGISQPVSDPNASQSAPDSSPESRTQEKARPDAAWGDGRFRTPEEVPLHAVAAAKVFPEISKTEAIAASLEALKKNGADLSKPMPARHQVLCESRQVAEQVQQWGRANQFEPAAPVAFHSHGEVEQFLVDLVRTDVPNPDKIHADGQRVFAGIATIPGALYHTWMGAVVR